MPEPALVDVHHHVVPASYRSAISAATDGTVGGVPIPDWDEASMLDWLDRLGIARVIVSISAPAVAPVDPAQRPAVARACNDEMADLVRRNPDIVGAFATLPMPDVTASLAELRRVMDELPFDGVSLLTNYDGIYLGDETFTPLLGELNRRGSVVHVHPNLPPPSPDMRLHLPAPVLEFTFDTTRMLAELIATETLQNYPGISMIVSHLGGTLPWVASRLSMLDAFPSRLGSGKTREPVRDQLRRIYYDVALSSTPATLRFAAEVVGVDRLLYGSDVPFAPPQFVTDNTTTLVRGVDGLDLAARCTSNARSLGLA